MLRQDPGNRFALFRSGTALLRLGEVARAVPRLRKASVLDPRQPDVRWALAEALGRAGQRAAAVDEWMEATRLQPRRAEAWANLGSALGLAGRAGEAVPALARAVELDPGNPRLLARLAFAEHAAGRLADAAGHLQQVAGLAGSRFPHSGALGLMLVELGRPEEARPWLARTAPSDPDYARARAALLRLDAPRPAR